MLLIIIFMVLGLALSILYTHSDCGDLGEYICNGFWFTFVSLVIGIWLSCIVGQIGHNEDKQAAVWTETYTLAAEGKYTLEDGDINFVYINEDGKFEDKTIDDNWNILPCGDKEPYVEITYYETTSRGLQLFGFGEADKGKVYNLYVADTDVSTTNK